MSNKTKGGKGLTGPLRRLEESVYQWNDRPSWPYAGPRRIIGNVEVDNRQFSISRAVNPLRWTIAHQAWAVGEGFFLHREPVRERPVIIGLRDRVRDYTFSYYSPVAAFTELERRAFQCQRLYAYCLDFIKQQDSFGFTGAWDKSVQCYAPDLRWYKLYVGATPALRKEKEALRQRVMNARDTRYIRKAQRVILGST